MKSLLSEALRPSSFEDLILPSHIKNPIQKMYDDGDVMNMLFYGKPGSGKQLSRKYSRIMKKSLIHSPLMGRHKQK